MKQAGVTSRGSRQSSLYVVAYDIPDDKRRTRVHKILKGFGQWTEFSLFECFLTKKERAVPVKDRNGRDSSTQRRDSVPDLIHL